MVFKTLIVTAKVNYILQVFGSNNLVNVDQWNEYIKIAQKIINIKIDTGAKCNVISMKDLKSLGIKARIKKSQKQNSSHTQAMYFQVLNNTIE